MNRRDFLAAAALSPLAASALRADAFPGMIVREREPVNLEMPFATLDSFLVPTERFFVRNHFPVPKVESDKWVLRVEGAVEKTLDLTLADLAAMPKTNRPVTLECAGNGRVFLTPRARGVAWQLGAVGNAEWGGVSLHAVLERAGVKSGAVEVVFEGADSGSINDDPKSPGPIHFTRSVPLAKCRQADGVILATTMNGKALTSNHGAPLRAVVAGWYGMASVKWLKRLIVVDRAFHGWWQSFDYTYHRRDHGLPVTVAIGEMRIKSAIARPVAGDVLKAGAAQRIAGAAWSGEADITKVEVSTDGGSTWREAKLREPAQRYAWRLWDLDWTPTAGRYSLVSRATDSRGHVQPERRDPDSRAYMIHHLIPTEIEVR